MRGLCHLAVLIALAAPAAADDATSLFEQGRALAAAGKQAEACAKFEDSFALERAIGTEINLADCRQHDGKLAEAWRMFDDAARNDTKPGRAKFARERADALVAQLGEVVIKLAAPAMPGLVVELGGRRLAPAAEIRERVEPGDVHVVASAPRRTSVTRDARVVAGGSVVIDLPPPPIAEPSPPPPPPHHEIIAPTTHRNRSRVAAAYILGGTGILGLAIAGGLGLSARGEYQDAIDSGGCVSTSAGLACDAGGKAHVLSAGDKADIATVSAVAGGALVVAGLAVYLTAPREVDRAVAVTPIVGDRWGVAVSGRF